MLIISDTVYKLVESYDVGKIRRFNFKQINSGDMVG